MPIWELICQALIQVDAIHINSGSAQEIIHHKPPTLCNLGNPNQPRSSQTNPATDWHANLSKLVLLLCPFRRVLQNPSDDPSEKAGTLAPSGRSLRRRDHMCRSSMNHVNTMNKETVKREPDWFINGTKTVQQWVKKHYSVSSVPFIPESRLCGMEESKDLGVQVTTWISTCNLQLRFPMFSWMMRYDESCVHHALEEDGILPLSHIYNITYVSLLY